MKTEKIDVEITKMKAKISAYQARLKELERKKTEQENTEIVGLVRGVNMTPRELAGFIRSHKAGDGQKKEEANHETE